jgi:hypothetical protein
MTEAISFAVKAFHRLELADVLISYADPNVGHGGGVYRAASWIALGQTNTSEVYRDKDGRLVTWRMIRHRQKRKTLADGYERLYLPGKHRFARGLTRLGKQAIARLQMMQLRCSGCGAKAEATCDCGVPYIPAHEFAALAIARDPKKSNRALAMETGLSKDTIRAARKSGGENSPPEKHEGRDGKTYPARRTRSRYPSKPLHGRSASMPPYDNAAILDGRTIYPYTVRRAGLPSDLRAQLVEDLGRLPSDQPAERTRLRLAMPWEKIVVHGAEWQVLKSSESNRKIGGVILKGRWKGFPNYHLSLEERATCPRSCHHWRNCFGNKMHKADRIEAGLDLESALEREVADLSIAHPAGFAVRLHVLGDFYSVEYVDLWRRLIERHSALHVWGYTARHDRDDPIASAVVALVKSDWDRFAIRFSNAPMPFDLPATITIRVKHQMPADAIICPEQDGKTESCSTCGLCWGSRKRIAFLEH